MCIADIERRNALNIPSFGLNISFPKNAIEIIDNIPNDAAGNRTKKSEPPNFNQKFIMK
jgi:hypothetical protein